MEVPVEVILHQGTFLCPDRETFYRTAPFVGGLYRAYGIPFLQAYGHKEVHGRTVDLYRAVEDMRIFIYPD